MKRQQFKAARLAARHGVIAVGLLLGVSGQAWAQFTDPPRACRGGGNYTLTLPASITVARDAPVGTILLAPVVGAQFPALYQCANSTTRNSAGVARRSVNLTRSGLRVNIVVSGQTLNNTPVYNTDVPGIGMVVAVRNLDTGCAPSDWLDVDTPESGLVEGWPNSTCNGAGNPTANAGLQWAIGLVKTATSVQPGMIAGKNVMEMALVLNNTTLAKNPEAQHGFVAISPVRVTVLTCSTPNVTVPMGDYPKQTFKGVGSTSNPVRFKVAINNCPAGMRSIGIQFVEPSSRYINQAQGVIQLSGDSTARGIGLKLTQPVDGAPMRFGNPGYVLQAYDPARGGSLEIAFDAAYYQAQSAVTAGSANAVLEFTMNYQ